MNKLTSVVFRRSLMSLNKFRFAASEGQVQKTIVNEKKRDDTITFYQNGQLVTRNAIVLKKREQIEEYVFKMVRDYFKTTNKANITLESKLSDHGLDSLDTIELAMQLEEDLGYQIPTENLPIFHKVKHFVNYIHQVENFKETYNRDPLA